MRCLRPVCVCMAMVVLGASSWVARGAADAGNDGKSTTVVGELVDVCFIASDGATQGPNHAKASADGLRAGMPAGILPENAHNSDELLYLLINPNTLAPYAGKTIKVEGTQLDHKHAFDPRRLWVQDGQGWLEVTFTAHPDCAPRSARPAVASTQQPATDAAETWKAPARAAHKENPVAADAQSLAAGKALYIADCTACHGVAGHSDGIVAKNLEIKPAELSSSTPALQTDGALFWKITEGHKPMPTWEKVLSETDRWNLINYIRTFASSSTPKTVAPPQARP